MLSFPHNFFFLLDYQVNHGTHQYLESKINKLIENIIKKKILNESGIIIIHRHKKDKLEITKKIKILDIRNYGISKVYFGN